MRSVPRAVLVIAALALPIIAVLVSVALTDGPRAPVVPASVKIGSFPGPDAMPTPTPLPTGVPPPPPDDDGDDGLDD
jgi:hypothetical protein